MSGTNIGGQAVPEGVMLRGSAGWALAVRRTDGTIAVETARARPRRPFTRLPFVRGLAAIADAFGLGLRTLSRAIALRHPVPPPPPPLRARVWGVVSLIGAVAFAAALFGYLPAMASSFFTGSAKDVAEPLVRTGVIVGYIAAIGLLPEIRRVFAYHGAEHQVVAAHEAGGDVTPWRANDYSRFHPRCGTTFVILVALIEGLVHSLPLVPSMPFGRVIEIPVAIVVAYEVVTLATKCRQRWWAKLLLAPGKGVQRLTTRRPDLDQLAVGCAALDALLSLDRGSEDQDQQQDDEQQDYESTTDVHSASSVRVAGSVPA